MSSPHAAARPSLLAATITAALAAVSGCAATTPATAVQARPGSAVTVEAVPATGATGLYIASDQGMFTRAGLRVRIVSSASAANALPDLLTGRVQVVLGQWTTALAARAHGTRLRALASGNNGAPGLEQLMTLPGSPVTRLSQLRGKVIAVNALNGLSQMLTESALAPDGITGTQVHWAVMPFQNMAAALAARKVTAAFMVEPYISQAEAALGLAGLTDLDTGPTTDIPITGYFTTAAWASQHPALAAAFTAALEAGQQKADTSRAAVEQAMVRRLHITPVIASMMAIGTFPLGVNPVQLGRIADLMRTDHLLQAGTNTTAVARALTGPT
jgi:NitT/TauT family transport system substrate-binding protein